MEGLKFHNQEKMKNPINIALLLVVMEVNALHLLLAKSHHIRMLGKSIYMS
jgi:hypothetical protein